MNWLNLHVSVLDSEAFLGADPSERATWLCLLRYCAGQENGGRIAGASQWRDRKWQQVVRVTAREIKSKCHLWSFDGEDLVVAFYPDEMEDKARSNRENGRKGGRPPKPSPKPNGNHMVSESETICLTTPETIPETKGKVIEGKGKVIEERESVRDFAEEAQRVVARYPRQEKMADALKIVMAHLMDGEDLQKMLGGTAACAEVIRKMPGGAQGAYVPSAEAFFRTKRWADDPQTLHRDKSPKVAASQQNNGYGETTRF